MIFFSKADFFHNNHSYRADLSVGLSQNFIMLAVAEITRSLKIQY